MSQSNISIKSGDRLRLKYNCVYGNKGDIVEILKVHTSIKFSRYTIFSALIQNSKGESYKITAASLDFDIISNGAALNSKQKLDVMNKEDIMNYVY